MGDGAAREEWPQLPAEALPAITASQMREVDRIMVEDLGIGLVQMMENAGRALADLALRRFRPATVLVLAGRGGNGGGGLVAARHLANRGAAVAIVLSPDEADLDPVPALQLGIVRRMEVEVSHEPRAADLVIDALIGYSLRGKPRGRAADLIRWTHTVAGPLLALDTPSGLDVTTGAAGAPCVRADATLTLALPKLGLLSAPQVGELYLADISVPPSVYARIGVQVPAMFTDATTLRVSNPGTHDPSRGRGGFSGEDRG